MGVQVRIRLPSLEKGFLEALRANDDLIPADTEVSKTHVFHHKHYEKCSLQVGSNGSVIISANEKEALIAAWRAVIRAAIKTGYTLYDLQDLVAKITVSKIIRLRRLDEREAEHLIRASTILSRELLNFTEH